MPNADSARVKYAASKRLAIKKATNSEQKNPSHVESHVATAKKGDLEAQNVKKPDLLAQLKNHKISARELVKEVGEPILTPCALQQI